jgi:hypothetical protein
VAAPYLTSTLHRHQDEGRLLQTLKGRIRQNGLDLLLRTDRPIKQVAVSQREELYPRVPRPGPANLEFRRQSWPCGCAHIAPYRSNYSPPILWITLWTTPEQERR